MLHCAGLAKLGGYSCVEPKSIGWTSADIRIKNEVGSAAINFAGIFVDTAVRAMFNGTRLAELGGYSCVEPKSIGWTSANICIKNEICSTAINFASVFVHTAVLAMLHCTRLAGMRSCRIIELKSIVRTRTNIRIKNEICSTAIDFAGVFVHTAVRAMLHCAGLAGMRSD